MTITALGRLPLKTYSSRPFQNQSIPARQGANQFKSKASCLYFCLLLLMRVMRGMSSRPFILHCNHRFSSACNVSEIFFKLLFIESNCLVFILMYSLKSLAKSLIFRSSRKSNPLSKFKSNI